MTDTGWKSTDPIRVTLEGACPPPTSSRKRRSRYPGSEGHGAVGGSPIPARAPLGRDDDGEGVCESRRPGLAADTGRRTCPPRGRTGSRVGSGTRVLPSGIGLAIRTKACPGHDPGPRGDAAGRLPTALPYRPRGTKRVGRFEGKDDDPEPLAGRTGSRIGSGTRVLPSGIGLAIRTKACPGHDPGPRGDAATGAPCERPCPTR